jgi:hypothetical protein
MPYASNDEVSGRFINLWYIIQTEEEGRKGITIRKERKKERKKKMKKEDWNERRN